MSTSPKTIQFLLPGAGVAGGVKVVFQYANYLVEQGHTVRIYYPGVLRPQSKKLWLFEAPLRNLKYKLSKHNEGREWFPLKAELHHVPSLEVRYIPAADITIATGVETADFVAKLPANRGEKFYFIQDWENWDVDDAAVAATWKLGLRNITISSTLAARATALDVPIEAVITNGMDPKVYHPNPPHPLGTPAKILMLSHYDPRKGIEDGFAAIRQLQATHQIELTLFGAGDPRPDMPEGARYFQRPNQETLRDLYAETDVFISPSHHEGCQLPPMEAMFCRAAVVATNVGGIPDYAIADKTALVIEPHHPEQIVAAVQKLLNDPGLLTQIQKAGYEHIQQFTLEKAASRFATAILDVPAQQH